jgi:hypothetical protein
VATALLKASEKALVSTASGGGDKNGGRGAADVTTNPDPYL